MQNFAENSASAIPLPEVKGVPFDLDGVLYVGSLAIEGAVETVRLVKAGGISYRFITKTSTPARESLCRKRRSLGFEAEAGEIFSAPQAALGYLKQQSDWACHLLLEEDVRRDFAEVNQAPLDEAAYIVLGDVGEAWSYDLLNPIFNRLMAGAQLIVIHKNRFWQTEEGLRMDIGGFVAALEYCSGAPAVVMGLPDQDVAIVGDDIDADIGSARAAGPRGGLVRAGKHRRDYVETSFLRPDRVIDSVRDLPALLGVVSEREA